MTKITSLLGGIPGPTGASSLFDIDFSSSGSGEEYAFGFA